MVMRDDHMGGQAMQGDGANELACQYTGSGVTAGQFVVPYQLQLGIKVKGDHFLLHFYGVQVPNVEQIIIGDFLGIKDGGQHYGRVIADGYFKFGIDPAFF
jgi:hypothetical protein